MEPVIVGWGHSKFGRFDALSLEDLIHSVAREAMESAGIEGKDVDAVWLGHFNSGLVADTFCSSMVLSADPGLRFKPANRCENACATGSAAVYAAIDAIRSGRVKVALVVGAEKMTHQNTAGVTRALAGASYQRDEAHVSFPEVFARYAQAYAEHYSDPVEAMAHIAVKNHENALLNPLAQMHRRLELDYCLVPSEKNPMIAAPLKVTDCSLISDGAAALVIVSDELLSDFPKAVGFRAYQQVNDYLPMATKDPIAFAGPSRAIAQAYAQAGVTVNDISLAEVHDCFTIAELMMVEALGVTQPGKAHQAVIEGQTRRDGKLPINLSGGLKSKGHPVGATGVSMLVTAARQLLGEAGDMQLPGASLVLTANMGGDAVASYVSILEAVKN
ncbi:thiolase domain-containing protein [Sphingobium sp. CECT 9361]|uniref:thiolase domain-containing protein n=1 Tax=Sphingobium sp. CECT 9361 TaxID=2845384 RepID=UPI001E4AEC57|nr:thiolase domain-containing protein [Sphingobium sp. CECT 9361]CAH0357043.1 3-ketoacyl-CoA thiolase [Sphingobium sp. CECT 9361]